ncbi:ATP-binding protein [Sphingomonas sp. G-3-2-10]|uniref:ATP-binding protein n=1 Tax=Sphingomonas sp. G-3-2-10 TaxID=2728838 RepID=UPI00146DB806|nr:ATP-binding protein [Sphingomonas sp. G-3-2-10]NML06938.1 HAMP domain-containing protein [Sphingomonas sp. G-3-2-10]
MWRRPRGMVGRIALVLIVALALELIGNVALHSWEGRELTSAEETRRVAEALVVAGEAVSAAPRSDRARIANDMSRPGLVLNWVPRTVITDFTPSLDRLIEKRARMNRFAPALAGRDLRLTILPSQTGGQRDLVGAMELADASFVTFRVTPYLAAPPGLLASTLMHLALMAFVLVAALLMVRTLVRPLRDLALAADETGRGQAAGFAIAGPHEVRRVATAFSAMQTRLLKLVEDHSQSLVAVSHDLRTPIQRLRLRAALLEDAEIRDPIAADLAEMERFIESTLAYVRDDAEEAQRLIDVATIVITAVDTAYDSGVDIEYRGPDTLPLPCYPIALKRVLANLIDNAERHAPRIEVTLAPRGAAGLFLAVDDDGPGIPEDRRAEMLLPFRRLDPARGGGAGLGLATSVKAVARMGGTLTLETSRLGGLRAVVVVERPPAG